MKKLTLELAKELNLMEFRYAEYLQNMRDILTEVAKLGTDTPTSDKLKSECIAELKLQHLKIELVYFGYDNKIKQPVIAFNISKEVNKDIWITTTCTELRVTPMMFQNAEYLEKLMFNFLIKQAKANKLTYDEYNN